MKTKITFEMESNTSVNVLLNGKKVGHIWSEDKKGSLPYPHKEDEKNRELIQICGFDAASEIWACGKFSGKKDLTLRFAEMDDTYYEERYKEEYKKYVAELLAADKVQEVKSYFDWVQHDGYPKARGL